MAGSGPRHLDERVARRRMRQKLCIMKAVQNAGITIPPPGEISSTYSQPFSVVAGILLLLAGGHVVATRLSWSGIPLQTDTGMWAYIGGRILDGAALYRDLWESKPPGIYYTFAVMEWLFGRGDYAAFLWLDAIVSAGVIGLTYAVARRVASPAAAAGASLLLSLVFCHRILADWGNNVEKFVALFDMLAILLLVGAPQRELPGSRGRWLGMGVCCGAAGLFKQTGCLLLIVLVLSQAMRSFANRGPIKPALARIGLLAFGAAVVWAPVAACLLWRGNFAGFWEQAVLYDLVRAGSAEVERWRLGTGEHWAQVGGTILLAAILLGPAFIGFLSLMLGRAVRPEAGRDEAEGSACLPLIGWYWLAATLVLAVAPYGYGHYLLQAAPPAAVLTASFLERVWQRRTNIAWAIAAVVVVIPGASSLLDHLRFTFDRSHEYRVAYQTRAALTIARVETVWQYTTPGQSVVLWPPDYTVSYCAGRRTTLEMSNADVIFQGKIGRLSPSMPELLRRLQALPPEVIVDWTPLGVEPPAPDDPTGEPQLLVPRGGFSLAQAPDDQHPMLEGRMLAPMQRWVRDVYGGQERVGHCTLYFYGRPWRFWREILPATAATPLRSP